MSSIPSFLPIVILSSFTFFILAFQHATPNVYINSNGQLVNGSPQHCKTVAFVDLFTLKPANKNLEVGPNGFSLHLPNGTCIQASKDDKTLERDFPDILDHYRKIMQRMDDEYSGSGKNTFRVMDYREI
jgi:hypothetical protein